MQFFGRSENEAAKSVKCKVWKIGKMALRKVLKCRNLKIGIWRCEQCTLHVVAILNSSSKGLIQMLSRTFQNQHSDVGSSGRVIIIIIIAHRRWDSG